MRRVEIDELGGPDVLHVVERPDPPLGPGDVAVAVDAAGITFVETQMRAGTFKPPGAPDIEFPHVFGNGVEGRVVDAGSDVDHARIGSRVVTATGGRGGYADRVVIDAAAPIAVPDGLELGQAVAMLADGRTALAQVRVADIGPDDVVLVLAAAGGVGSLLVQRTHEQGATVLGAAGGARKTDLVTALGADNAVDYTSPTWCEWVRDGFGAVDVVFDGVGGELGAAAAGLLRPGGRRVTIGMASGRWAGGPTEADAEIVELRGTVDGPDDNRELVGQALAAAADERWRAIIGQTYDLAHAADAHRAIEARSTIGKTILVPDRNP
jgi:NADPH2:quinone reductase